MAYAALEAQASGVAPVSSSRLRPDLWGTLLVTLMLCLLTFVAGGGLTPTTATQVEMALTVVGGLVIALTVLALRDRAHWKAHGMWPAVGILALTAVTAISVAWSVTPDASWQEANLILAYAVTFIAASVLARAAPARAPAILGGIVLSSAIICGYALATKVFPAELDASAIYSRLQAPYGYWNAIGLTGAMGVLACVWLGARRTGHAALNALAYPTLGLCFVTMMLAYSRGALLALALGLILWFTAVPLRLRGAAVLIVGAGAGLPVVAWAFRSQSLSENGVPLVERTIAGHQFGVLMVALLIVLLAVGLSVGYVTGRRAPSMRVRRRAGTALIIALACLPVLVVGALTVSQRGLTGTITHDYNTLTDLNPPTSNGPSRLTDVGSVRALYWDEALKVWRGNRVLGAGAGGYQEARLRYAHDTLNVRDAHGYVVQTLADLGLVGLAVSLALLLIWGAAAGRAARPYGLRWVRPDGGGVWRLRRVAIPFTDDRVALLTMLAIVVLFGISSTVDWTWFIPGNACVALLCAGWLAGRGPVETLPARSSIGVAVARRPGGVPARVLGTLGLPAALRLPRRNEIGIVRTVIALAIVAFALIGAWTQWQPQRSVAADQDALSAFAHNPTLALKDAQLAVSRDPLSAEALQQLGTLQSITGDTAAAQATFNRAVTLQPANHQTWLWLAAFEESPAVDNPTAALAALRPAIFLDPTSTMADGEYVYALRQMDPTANIAGVAPAISVEQSNVAGAGGGH